MNTKEKNEYMRRYWDTVLQIDVEGGRLNPCESVADLYDQAYKAFTNEYGHEIKRYGVHKAFTDWLSGLALAVDFYNVDILKHAGNMGIDISTESKQERILLAWWDFQTTHFFKNARHYRAAFAVIA